MIELIRTSGICIKKDYENERFYKEIKYILTRNIREYQTSIIKTLYFYNEGPYILKIPRFYPVEELFNRDNISFKIIDKVPDGQDILINHNISFRDDLQKNIAEYMLKNENGLIKARPGSGKTVVSIYVVATLKKKAFILVHRDSIAKQWIGPGTEDKKQGFLAYTDLNSNEIGRLNSSNYKKVLQKSVIVCTDQVFTSLLRNHRKEFLIELNKSNIGIFIADEVHTSVGAPTFAECSLHIPSKIVFGLSATPKRWDGNYDIMEYHLGKLFVPEGTASTMDARVTVILFDFGFLPKSRGYIYYAGFFQKSRYYKILKNSKRLVNICTSLINKFYIEKRNIIFMGERIHFLELISQKLKNIKDEDKGHFFGIGDEKEIEKPLTLATPGKMRDGVDAVEKDCLLMTNPISNIDQMSGRILRPKKDKDQPIIIDLVDIGIKEIFDSLSSRLNFYHENNWSVKFLLLDNDGNKIPVLEEYVLELLNKNREEQ